MHHLYSNYLEIYCPDYLYDVSVFNKTDNITSDIAANTMN